MNDAKIETWHAAKSNPKTEKWNSMNNERRELFLRSSTSSNSNPDEQRQLKAKVPEYCSDFKFEFAIDGKVTSWDQEEFLKNMGHIQRVVETLKIVEDPSITGGE